MNHKPKKGYDFVGSVCFPCQSEVSLGLVHVPLVPREILHASSTEYTIISEAPSGIILFLGLWGRRVVRITSFKCQGSSKESELKSQLLLL